VPCASPWLGFCQESEAGNQTEFDRIISNTEDKWNCRSCRLGRQRRSCTAGRDNDATGVTFLLAVLGAKQLGLLRELVPAAKRIGLLVNPNNTTSTAQTSDVVAAASSLGTTIDVVRASDSREIEAAFALLVRDRAEALLVGTDPFFYSRRVQLATLAARHAIPAIYPVRENVEVGGLMSYGTSLSEVYRQVGAYTVRILKGAKPADLPVVRSTKFELVINLPTARALGLAVPPTLLARADEVIE
jgi:putative ABC transport system substrate-binding protein